MNFRDLDIDRFGMSFVARVSRREGDLFIEANPPMPLSVLERLATRTLRIGQAIEIPNLGDEPEWLAKPWSDRTYSVVCIPISGESVIVMGFIDRITHIPENLLEALAVLLNATAEHRPRDVLDWIGVSTAHHALLRRFDIAMTNVGSVWIEGEPGTGRHTLARLVAANRGLKVTTPADHGPGVVVARPGDAAQLDRDARWRRCDHLLEIPPLRFRLEDLSAMVHAWNPSLTEADHDRLRKRPWPGNIRELKWVTWQHEALDEPIRVPGVMTAGELRTLEKKNLKRALTLCNDTIYGPRGAASLVGLAGSTFASRLKALGIERP